MDDLDRASLIEDAQREEALDEFRRRHPPADRPSAEFCVHCEERIPDARRRAVPGCQLCVDCQAYFEMVMETGG